MATRRITGIGSICAAVISAIALSSSLPGATTLRRMRLPEIAARSERIVHARAIDQRVYWDGSGKRIYTDTTFEVIEQVKGRGPDRVTVTMLGGRISPIVMMVEGTPQFRVGEELVLFTSPRPDGKSNLVGFSQGLMRIVEDPATGERIAVGASSRGVRLVESAEKGLKPVEPDRRRVPLSQALSDLRRMVSEANPDGTVPEIQPLNPGQGDSRRRQP